MFVFVNREELIKRRRGQNNQAPETTTTNQADLPQNIDFETYSVEEALNYQKTSGIDLQTFTDGIANKMKFKVSLLDNLTNIVEFISQCV